MNNLSELIKPLCNLIVSRLDELIGIALPSGFFHIEDDKIFYVHHSTVCFYISENSISFLNTPNASKNFIKRCFFNMYCDTISKLFDVGEDPAPLSETYENRMMSLIALKKKAKELAKWEVYTADMD